MLRKILSFIVISVLVFSVSGCALLSTAISAGIGYGIYQATKK